MIPLKIEVSGKYLDENNQEKSYEALYIKPLSFNGLTVDKVKIKSLQNDIRQLQVECALKIQKFFTEDESKGFESEKSTNTTISNDEDYLKNQWDYIANNSDYEKSFIPLVDKILLSVKDKIYVDEKLKTNLPKKYIQTIGSLIEAEKTNTKTANSIEFDTIEKIAEKCFVGFLGESLNGK